MILLNVVVREKVNPLLAKKFHAFYGNRCSKHIICCHSRSQMNPFRSNALSFFKVHLMYLVQLGLPSVPFQIFHKALCSFLFSRLYPTCPFSLTLLVYTLLIIPDEYKQLTKLPLCSVLKSPSFSFFSVLCIFFGFSL
jgi:hypothetical protein